MWQHGSAAAAAGLMDLVLDSAALAMTFKRLRYMVFVTIAHPSEITHQIRRLDRLNTQLLRNRKVNRRGFGKAGKGERCNTK